LNSSRNIKIPFTPKRMLNIQYITDELIKYHPDEIKPVHSFTFDIDRENKNLTINEITEFTLLMKDTDFNLLLNERNKKSTEAVINLLSQYRLFNLTKLLKKAKKRTQLTQLMKTRLGKDIFTFKNFCLDKNGLEISEDYCFHSDNYESVRRKLDLELIKKIIESHSIAINRRLKNFGILNPNVSDYRDSKLDYLMNILTGEMAPAFNKKEIIDIKNFKSLRDCLIKVDKILDPAKLLNNDIMEYVQSQNLSTDRDIMNIFEKITPDIFTQWEAEASNSGKVIIYTGDDKIKYIIDSNLYPKKFEELIQLIVYNPELFNSLSETERNNKTFTAEIYSEAGKEISSKDTRALKVLKNQETIGKVADLIKDFEYYKKNKSTESANEKDQDNQPDNSIVAVFINFIKSIFSKNIKSSQAADNQHGIQNQDKKAKKTNLSKTAKDIYKQIINKNSIIAVISDFIEIKPENEKMIDQIIGELRTNNLRIVIPIYNARQVLYPIRSKKYLIADVDYVIVDPEIPRSPEAIRDYTDSITGYKIKEDTLSGNALFQIEKYLMTIYRQNRAKMKRKKK
ncbi:MAG: hypothetical protein WDA74_03300, partial [Spirochaetota bacterium]